MDKRYVIAVDQSTSSTKAFLLDREGKTVAQEALQHKTYYPRSGWVEHDPEEIFKNVLEVIFGILSKAKVAHEEVAVIALTNQRETTVVWDKRSGKPVCRAPVWQCVRSADICEELNRAGVGDLVRKRTGYMIVPSPPGSKIRWIMENVEGAYDASQRGELLFGQIDSWLLWNLTGGKAHATDYSNASRSILFDINKLQWDAELLREFKVHPSMTPKVRHSDEIFGYTDTSHGFSCEIPISGLTGDSHAALFGHQCFEPGMAKITYGTGSSIMTNIGLQPKDAAEGLVTSIGWAQDHRVHYVFEGNVNFAGATVDWLSKGLGLIEDMEEFDREARSVESSEGVYVVPAFAGLGAPYWDNSARAAILGMTLGTSKAHVARAAMESIAYQVADILQVMSKESGTGITGLRVDGGPTANTELMQFQADLLGIPIHVSDAEDASALGAALLAGIGVGFWKNMREIEAIYASKAVYTPRIEATEAEKRIDGWREAVKRVLTGA